VRCLSGLVAGALLACSNGASGAHPLSMATSAIADSTAGRAATEAIPAEWTVSEDTSANGDVTTTSLQLPAAKEIQGLPGEESPRLILRCLDGRVAAFIAAESTTSDSPDDSAGVTPEAVPVELDSAPSCE
jgi:hypothetical protein